MTWTGKWRNQYGSIVEVSSEADGKIVGTFTTALPDSGFAGMSVDILGVCSGDCISFSCAAKGRSGDTAVGYTGLLRDGKMETLWFVVSDQAIKASGDGEPAHFQKLEAWRAFMISADSFERLA